MTRYVFGYGSLVHSGTHDYPPLAPAKLIGWKRAWRGTDLRGVAFLTAVPDPDWAIAGAVVPVPEGSWEALDAREFAYERRDVSAQITGAPIGADIATYAIAPKHHRRHTPLFPILQSYLDTVLAGYDMLFGAEGVRAFLATTDGWDTPIRQDRHRPKYPRSQTLNAEQMARFDAALDALNVTRIAPNGDDETV